MWEREREREQEEEEEEGAPSSAPFVWRKGALITPCTSFIKYLFPDVNVCVEAPSAKRQKRDSKRDRVRRME